MKAQDKIIECLETGLHLEKAVFLSGGSLGEVILLLRNGEVEADRIERGLKARASHKEAYAFYERVVRAREKARERLIEEQEQAERKRKTNYLL